MTFFILFSGWSNLLSTSFILLRLKLTDLLNNLFLAS
jgi:hypothetical protein